MKTYFYKQVGNIKSTEPHTIVDEQGTAIATVNRVYDNGLKKLFDGYFDYRYFLKYAVHGIDGQKQFEVKKIFRRGKVWFEGKDFQTNNKYLISYENWRIGVPELFINSDSLKMKIEKVMEGWSEFIVEEQIIARWKADYDELADEFFMTLEIEANSPVQEVPFFVGIAQASLFIGV